MHPPPHLTETLIRQVRCRFAHSLAEEHQVFVELSIIEGAKGEAHSTLINGHQTWQLEERQESPPRRMGIGLMSLSVYTGLRWPST
jgi:hypothetical protein